MDSPIVPIGILCAAVAALVGLGFLIHNEQAAWEKFSTAHHCKKVAEVKGDFVTVTTVGSNGSVGIGTAYTGDKTGYFCDDGVTYYR